MKIKNINLEYKTKLIKLQILKSKIYKTTETTTKKIEISKIKLYLKKISHIIYEYHINNKTILFINFTPNLIDKLDKLKKNTKHKFLNKENLTNGFITNESKINNIQKLKFKNIFDLIVINNSTNNNILIESSTLYIPTITITKDLMPNKLFLLKQSYPIIGNFEFTEEQTNNNFFSSLFYAIFKKAIIKKQKKIIYIEKKI